MATYTDNYNLIKPSYSEIADVATINTNMNTIDDIMHSSQVSLAPAYDATQTYNTGDVVMYELLMYKCTDDNVTGTWNASKWERTTASECGDSGSGGTSVVPNPQGEPTDTLETIEIDGTVYDIAGSGGGGSARKLYKKLYNGNITSTGEVTLLESIENYDFIMIELAYLIGEGNPICGSTIADVPYLKSTYNNETSIWVDGGNNDRSAKIAFSNATTMKVNKASAADAIIGVYGFKLEASGGGGTDVEANPSGTATEELNKLRVDNTIYSIPEGSEVVVYGEASGNIAEFDDGSNKPMSKCKIDINAVQSGSGDPSPTNIRPISGFTEANIVVSPTTDAQDGTTYSVSWESQAGTVYGGTLDVTIGVLTVDRASVDLGEFTWQKWDWGFIATTALTNPVVPATDNDVILGALSSDYKVTSANAVFAKAVDNRFAIRPSGKVVINDSSKDSMTESQFKAAMSGVQLVYELATPLTYQLTPIQVNSLLGINNVWNDTNGETEVKYIRDLNTTINILWNAVFNQSNTRSLSLMKNVKSEDTDTKEVEEIEEEETKKEVQKEIKKEEIND